jgi:hypothetical protein
MRLIAFLGAVLVTSGCAAPAPVAPSPGPFRFSGTISAVDGGRVGNPIAGARLTVIDGANLNATVDTNAAGQFAFESLDSGKFTLTIAAPGFASATPVVQLYRDIEANFALTPQ